MKTPVRGQSGHVIGYVEVLADGRQKALDENYRILAYYDPASDLTKDRFNLVVGRGNQLVALIRQGR
jgi:hypothetical protein